MASENLNLIWNKIHAMNVIIKVLEIWGNHQEAADMNKQIWQMVYEMYGENHITVIEKEVKYMVSLCVIGEAEEAIAAIRNCYEKMAKLVGENYVDLVNVKYALTNAYVSAKNYVKALELGRETEAAYLEQLDEAAMEVIDTKRVIIECLKQLGLYDEAIAKSQEQLILLEEKNKNTALIAQEFRMLAELYYLKKDYAKSKELFTRYREMHLLISEEDHINIITVYKWYGDIAMREGDYAQAIGYYEKMIIPFVENEWDRWSDLQEAQMSSVMCHIGLKEYDKALELFEQINYYTEDASEEQKLVALLKKLLDEGMLDAAKAFVPEIEKRIGMSCSQWLWIKDILADYYLENGLLDEVRQICLEMLEFVKETEPEQLDEEGSEAIMEMEKNALRKLTFLEAVLHNAQAATEWGEQYLALSMKFYEGYPYNQFFSLMDMAWTYQYLGMNENGQSILEEAKEKMELFEVDEYDEFYYRRIRVKYLTDAGKFEEAHAETDRLQELVEEYGMADSIMELNNSLAYLAYAEGKIEEAKAYLDEAIYKTKYTCNSGSPYARECYEFRERLEV